MCSIPWGQKMVEHIHKCNRFSKGELEFGIESDLATIRLSLWGRSFIAGLLFFFRGLRAARNNSRRHSNSFRTLSVRLRRKPNESHRKTIRHSQNERNKKRSNGTSSNSTERRKSHKMSTGLAKRGITFN